MELQSLIISAKKGDRETFRVFYNLLSPRIFRFIRPRARNREDALDVLQETFIDFWKGLEKFTYQNDKALEAFLLLIATRKLSKNFRFWKRYIPLDEVEDIVADETTPEDRATLEVTFALAKLNTKDRELIVLRDIEGRSFAEISEILGVSENALKVRHHRALIKIKEKASHE